MSKARKRIVSLALAIMLICFSTITASAATDYASTWVNKSTKLAGVTDKFNITSTNSGNVGVTYKLESSSNNSYAIIYLRNPNGLIVVGSERKVYANTGDIYFRINGVKGKYTVCYTVYPKAGTRLMCWMYK